MYIFFTNVYYSCTIVLVSMTPPILLICNKFIKHIRKATD